MENAAKALTIAGGVLLALMILGALMLMFNNLSSYQNQNDASAKQAQIAEFNNQFEPYNKEDLTLMELKSVYNKIISHNTKNSENQIETNIREVYPNIDQDFANKKFFSEEDKQNRVYQCTKIEYKNAEGRISSMKFKKVK